MFTYTVFSVDIFQMWYSFQWLHADMSVQTYIVSAEQVPELFYGFFSQLTSETMSSMFPVH